MHDGTCTPLPINDPDSLNNDAGVTSVAISPDGRWVAAGSLDTVVRIWEVATAKLVERLRGHRDSVYSVAFTPDGRGLVSGSLDKTLKYWDVSALGGGAGGASAGSASAGAVKGKKEGTSGAAAAGSAVAVGGGSSRKEEKTSPCTMNFTGHKVRFCCPHLPYLLTPPFLSLHRTTSSPSLSPTTAHGSSQGPKTAEFSSGTRGRRLCSACSKVTRIR